MKEEEYVIEANAFLLLSELALSHNVGVELRTATVKISLGLSEQFLFMQHCFKK
jgi:hypothetical protein